jgi:hypothetical protein
VDSSAQLQMHQEMEVESQGGQVLFDYARAFVCVSQAGKRLNQFISPQRQI